MLLCRIFNRILTLLHFEHDLTVAVAVAAVAVAVAVGDVQHQSRNNDLEISLISRPSDNTAPFVETSSPSTSLYGHLSRRQRYKF